MPPEAIMVDYLSILFLRFMPWTAFGIGPYH